MRAILDTHAFLWAASDTRQLSPRARQLFDDTESELLLSAVTVWEIAIKTGLKKLRIDQNLPIFIEKQIRMLRLKELGIETTHAVAIAELPPLHDDPFDRMLVAQATVERLPIVSRDALIARYPVDIIW